jgi:hypothetical protein
MRSPFLLLASVLVLAPTAAATTLDIKPGLWERITTQTIEGGAEPRALSLERLTPEQRARIEERLAERGQPVTRKMLQCVTPAVIAEWSSFEAHERETPDCKRTFIDETPQHVKYTASCNDGRTTGDFEFTAASSEHVDAQMSVIERSESGERRIRTVWRGRWLAQSCGDLAAGKTKRIN